MSIQQAIVFNNSAVLDLHHGKLTEGVQSMRRAIAVLKELSDPSENSSQSRIQKDSETNMESSSSSAGTILEPSHHASDDAMCVDKDTSRGSVPSIRLVQVDFPQACENDTLSSVVFNQIIFLDANISDEDHEIVCSCVLFNMALAHHIKGVTVEASQRNAWITKAMQLYKIVLRILERLPQVESPSIEILYLATLNNLSHIYFLHSDRISLAQHAEAMNLMLARAGAWEDNQVLSYFAMNAIFYKAVYQVAPAA